MTTNPPVSPIAGKVTFSGNFSPSESKTQIKTQRIKEIIERMLRIANKSHYQIT